MLHNETLSIVETIADTRRLVAGWRAAGLTVGLVPTMGSLHAGHATLIDRARAENDRVLATIFVNPLQFGPAEDFAAYPRDREHDVAVLREHDCSAVFVPTVATMFPDGGGTLDKTPTRVSVASLARTLCGASRPGHFDGVATIVLKLLLIAQPDTAYFGEKDFQQLRVIGQLVHDLNVPVRICGVPIVREPDGLALSSRNAYLTAEQRALAPELYRTLTHLRATLAAAPHDSPAALERARRHIIASGFDRIDYLELGSSLTLEIIDRPQNDARLFAAAWLGRTRLIDNIALVPA